MWKQSDGGRTESGFKEKRDCTVRAFALACSIEYAEAHKLCKEHGRKDRRGFCGTKKKVQAIIQQAGRVATQVSRSGSLGKLRRLHPVGRMFVLMRGHAFAVIDGVVHDLTPLGEMTRIKGAWKIS